MHHAQLRAQPLHILLDINFQRLDIHTILMQRMQDLLLKRKSRLHLLHFGLLPKPH